MICPSIYLIVCVSTCASTHLTCYIDFAFNLHIYILEIDFFIPTVIRAKISGEKIVSPSNNSSPYMKMIQYEIKMIKVRCLKKLKCPKHVCWSSLILICLLVHDLSRCLIFNYYFFKFCFCWPLCRCLKVLTKPRISSMFTLQSSLHCVVSNWTTTTKLGICSQVSVCATFFDFRTGKMCRELKTDHMFFYTSVFLSGTYFSFERFVSFEVFTFQVAILLVIAKGVKRRLIC